MPDILSSDGVRLHYRVEGTGAPLLLLNGLFGDSAFWDPVVEHLRGHRTCILHDHRGIGDSEWWPGPHSYPLWARDAVEVLDAAGFPRAPVLGLCNGGMVGAEMALGHPGRITGLVAHGTRLLESAKLRVFDRFRLKLLEIGGVELMMGAQMGLGFGEAALQQVEPHVARMAEKAISRISPQAAGSMLEALAAYSMSPLDVARMGIPALFLAGEEDLYVPPWLVERTARLWPGAEFGVMKGVGHIVPREAPEDLARRTLDFLGRSGL